MSSAKVLASHMERLAICSGLKKFEVLEACSEVMLGVIGWPEHHVDDDTRKEACEALAEYFTAQARVLNGGRKKTAPKN